MSEIKKLTDLVVKHRNARNWKQYHNPKDSSIALHLEASELLEKFIWQNNEEMEENVKEHKDEIAEELADIFYWVLLLSHDLKIDISKAYIKKMKENAKKYPVKKAKGKHYKYTYYKK